jgi:8-oxo-dGTP diphosphatase
VIFPTITSKLMPNTAPEYLHVVAAVIRGGDGRILLAQRPLDKHQGGKWEFPGGKLEAGETPLQALSRELHEELGIIVRQASPLTKVRHLYPERAVLLDVWEVTAFSGEPHGREGQPVTWFEARQMRGLEFPPANYPIVTAAILPDYCLVTPEPGDPDGFLHSLSLSLAAGIRLVQFRTRALPEAAYVTLARQAAGLVHEAGGRIILNSPPVMLDEADGLHLTSRQLQNWSGEALQVKGKLLSASCHNLAELERAAEIGVDFALLAPVLPTASHPGAAALGWNAFSKLADQVNFPVYALGGIQARQLALAREHGARGVAGISAFWGKQVPV